MNKFEIEVPKELIDRLEAVAGPKPVCHPYRDEIVALLRKVGKIKTWKSMAKVLTEYYHYPIHPDTLRKWYAQYVKGGSYDSTTI
jgi:hypothetical protein